MAMWDFYGPTQDEILDAFNKAAAEGQKYLLLFSQNTTDVLLVTTHDYTRPVADESEIIPLLRSLNKHCSSWGGDVQLSTIFDLSKKFDLQQSHEHSLKETLSPQVRRELASYGEEARRKRAQREWDRKPWLERLFSNRPL